MFSDLELSCDNSTILDEDGIGTTTSFPCGNCEDKTADEVFCLVTSNRSTCRTCF